MKNMNNKSTISATVLSAVVLLAVATLGASNLPAAVGYLAAALLVGVTAFDYRPVSKSYSIR
jgi:hypothetical protein